MSHTIPVKNTQGVVNNYEWYDDDTFETFRKRLSVKEGIKESEIRITINNTDLQPGDKLKEKLLNQKDQTYLLLKSIGGF